MLSVNRTKIMSGEFSFDTLPFFRHLNTSQRSLLVPLFTRCEFPTETAIFEQGAPAEFFYLLVRGEVIVRFKPYDGPELTIAHVRPGEIFGWSAALGSPAYTTTAISLSDCNLLRMRGSDLYRTYRQNPVIGEILVEMLADGISDRYPNTRNQVVALLEYGIRNPKDDRRHNHGNAS
jgi:CRP-like cAMP-binding protein